MSVSPSLRLKDQICHSLYSATNALVRAYRPLLDRLELTYPQYLVMMALWEKDQVQVKNLVERTRFDAGTLTPILKRLEQKQLLKRGASKEDGRQKVITLTQAGTELEQEALQVPEQLMCHVDMTLSEARELKALSEKLYLQLVGAVSEA